ncbi:MAG: GreA/GreB family elongation factor [Acidobacteriota bacterium]|jgi:transcription elongation factor GreB
MNKAFTKESDYDETAEAVVEPVDPLPPNVPNYVTPAGAERVRAELRRLLREEIPRLEARAGAGQESDGARDNREKTSARRQLQEAKGRARLLDQHIGRFQVVDPSTGDGDRVRFGARVTVLDDHGDERTYLICGVDEAQPELGSVSWISPVAKALLGCEVGDEVTLRLPRGEQRLEIVDIEYDTA